MDIQNKGVDGSPLHLFFFRKMRHKRQNLTTHKVKVFDLKSSLFYLSNIHSSEVKVGHYDFHRTRVFGFFI